MAVMPLVNISAIRGRRVLIFAPDAQVLPSLRLGVMYKGPAEKGPAVERPHVKWPHVIRPHVKRPHPIKAPSIF